MLLQIVAQSLAYRSLDCAYHFVVSEFGLGLSLELGLHHFHGNYCRKTVAEVIARNLYLGVL